MQRRVVFSTLLTANLPKTSSSVAGNAVVGDISKDKVENHLI
jgi:hypothetical protein